MHGVLVVQKWSEEGFEPDDGNGDGGIVAIRCHVECNEHPLGKFVCLKIFVEQGGVLDLGKIVWANGDRIV